MIPKTRESKDRIIDGVVEFSSAGGVVQCSRMGCVCRLVHQLLPPSHLKFPKEKVLSCFTL